ncbi:MAG: hypothetical protein A2Z70_00745 [Chloroflexi bacterium RBG_13_48_17]|nr:MAG: hypothetical protein A2Z70_00745 [Chloroflexi bacterium RBG_13_48_17]
MNWPFAPSLKKKEVLLLRPLDYRGETLPVENETDRGVYCRKIKGVNRLFFKFGPAWTFPNVIRFLGVEGTPITAHPTIEGVKIPIKDFLLEVWPKGAYDAMPDTLKNPIETDIGVICGIKATMPDENMDLESLNADALLKEADAAQMKEFGKSTPKKDWKRDMTTFLIPAALGFFAGIVVQLKGWF